MRSTTSITTKIILDHPQFHFAPSTVYSWNPTTSTIHYVAQPEDTPSLLHELSHALLRHKAYTKDIELIRLESEAWSKTLELAESYSLTISEDVVQENLDTYRDWLHKKSICPHCESIGVQKHEGAYVCLICTSEWSVNEARTCSVRRILKTAIH